MALEQTLSIIKPDAVAKGHVDEICRRLEESGLSIVDKQSLHLDEQKAEGFYAVSYTHLTLPTILLV